MSGTLHGCWLGEVVALPCLNITETLVQETKYLASHFLLLPCDNASQKHKILSNFAKYEPVIHTLLKYKLFIKRMYLYAKY